MDFLASGSAPATATAADSEDAAGSATGAAASAEEAMASLTIAKPWKRQPQAHAAVWMSTQLRASAITASAASARAASAASARAASASAAAAQLAHKPIKPLTVVTAHCELGLGS